MKVAVIGSRGLLVENLGDYLPGRQGSMPAQESMPSGTGWS